MTIIELSPGGWYTEILANYIHYPGTLIAAHFNANSDIGYYRRSRAILSKKFLVIQCMVGLKLLT